MGPLCTISMWNWKTVSKREITQTWKYDQGYINKKQAVPGWYYNSSSDWAKAGKQPAIQDALCVLCWLSYCVEYIECFNILPPPILLTYTFHYMKYSCPRWFIYSTLPSFVIVQYCLSILDFFRHKRQPEKALLKKKKHSCSGWRLQWIHYSTCPIKNIFLHVSFVTSVIFGIISNLFDGPSSKKCQLQRK